MKVERAECMGFCFGVENAVKQALNTVNCSKESVYAVGSIIHNAHVSSELEEEGLKTVLSIDEVPSNSTIIIRSHGEGKDFYITAKDKGLNVIDTTCPNVSKIHDLVKKADEEGKKVVIVGDENHPEVKGIISWTSDPTVLDSVDKARKIGYDGCDRR